MVFLKRIEAQGFKSFADKVNIKFDSGVTAVVGPNGSGKSNITDAIRWVLGEQSARVMRGAKMEDVIFDGTENRNPMNSASVSLILDNNKKVLGDEAEVVISRKLYRNGDSEYFINKEKVKLKNITELFMDSGLGKNAYNIISQGQVDEILNAKPLERRKIIEEAAGVMKYKSRKIESEKRLEETKQNLLRVHDIIEEISSRVERLERESAVAEEYLALKEEMTESDIEVTVYDAKLLASELKDLKTAINKEETTLKTSREKLESVLNEQTELNNERDELEAKSKSLNNQLLEDARTLEQIEGRIALYAERETNKETLREDLNSRLEKNKSEITTLKKQLQKETTKKDELANACTELATKIKNKEREISVIREGNDTDIEELKDQYYQLMVEKTTLENDKRRNHDEQSKIENNIRYKSERLETLLNEVSEAESKLKDLKAGAETTGQNLNKARQAYKDTKSKLDSLNENYDQAKSDYNRAENFIQNQQSKLDMLRNMEENYQGYYPGVRAILKNKKSIPGVVGPVGELISANPEYMTALDTALGQASQNIVMDVEYNARTAIQFLKQKKLGFATFLPLDTIKERHLSVDIENALQSSGVEYQILSEVTDIDRAYRKVILHLLNTTIVVKNLEDASRISRASNQRVRIITLDGDIIMPGGAMSGGSKNRKGSIMETKKEIADITEKINAYKSQTAELENKVNRYREQILQATAELKTQENSGLQLAEVYDEAGREIAKLEYALQSKNENVKEIQKEVDGLSASTNEENLDQQIENLTSKMADIETSINMMSRSNDEKDKEIETLSHEIQQLNNDKISKDGDVRYTRASISRIEASIEDLENQVANIESEISMVDDDLSAMNIEELETNKTELTQTVATIKSSQQENDEKLVTVKDALKSIASKETALRAEIDDCQSRLRGQSAELEGVDTKLENKLTYISDNYKMTYELALSKFDSFENIEEKRQKITLNKKSIEELGPVNLGSIEEFKTVNERFTFLKEQEADLIDARQTLLDVIAEMDEEVSVRFKDTFIQVNVYFQDVFSEMFGGGRAELRLQEPDNYLDSGIEIFAEPPGKKLSSLSLLSGGERALTAISLLFSVLKVKVSPFIILDEVEAALDEANVIRYARYLKKLSHDTQFIVITHRKGTMEESDRLFGVTMQEKGVTKLISVDLKNYVDPGVNEEKGRV